MLEKTGALLVTKEELKDISSGSLPDRIKNEWDLSLEEVLAIIQSGRYQVLNDCQTDY